MNDNLTTLQILQCLSGNKVRLVHGKFKCAWLTQPFHGNMYDKHWPVFVNNVYQLTRLLNKKSNDVICIFDESIAHYIQPSKLIEVSAELKKEIDRLYLINHGVRKTRKKKATSPAYEVIDETELIPEELVNEEMRV